MSSHKLITVIVPHNKSNIISESAQKSGSFGGTILTGRGISANKLLGFLFDDNLIHQSSPHSLRHSSNGTLSLSSSGAFS